MNVIDLLAIIAVPAIVLVAALCYAASVMGRLRRQHREDMAAFDRQAEALLKTFHDRGPIQAGAITAARIEAGAISAVRFPLVDTASNEIVPGATASSRLALGVPGALVDTASNKVVPGATASSRTAPRVL